MGNKDKLYLGFACTISVGILFLYFFPYFYLGQNSYITIHDNLDSDVVWFKTIAQSGKLFTFTNDTQIDNIMNGIPRNSLPPAFNFISVLFYFLKPFTAYMVNNLLIHIVAFVGMFLLLKDFVFNKRDEIFFLFSISIIFALVPFYGTHPGLAIAGIPIVTWCFVHFYKHTYRSYHFAILLFFSFYSSLIYSGVFIIIFLFAILIYLILYRKTINWPFIFGIAVLVLGYIISELNLFIQFFSNDFISHRTEWSEPGIHLINSLKEGVSFFLNGQYHAPTLNTPFVTLICLIGLFNSLRCFEKNNKNSNKYEMLVIIVFLLITSISLFYGLWGSNEFIELKGKVSILRMLQWNRFHWLTPFLWYILFALCIKVLLPKNKNIVIQTTLYMFVLLQLLFVVYNNNELKHNYYKIVKEIYPIINHFQKASTAPSFKQFYDEKLFSEIKEYIGLPQSEYRVISLGICPEIAIYNGFYALDSYQRNYCLNYKHKFRKIICSELNKSDEIKEYYDNWGSRCYAFSAEFNRNYTGSKNDSIIIQNLDFDFDALKILGGRYIISTVLIDPTINKRVVLQKSFEHRDSYWKIYLYEVF